MSCNSAYRSSGWIFVIAVPLLIALACSKLAVEEHPGKVTEKVIFASIGKEQHLVILRPALLKDLFGNDWYKQSLFVDRSHTAFLGQSAPPEYLWNMEDGLAFRENMRKIPLESNEMPMRITIYSLEKKIGYSLRFNLRTQELEELSCARCPGLSGELPPKGFLLHGLESCTEWKRVQGR